jgi:group I intron endonuclease
MSIIYRAVNVVNEKSYIGYSKSDLSSRKRQHKYAYQTTDRKFYRAIRKYGWDNFVWEVLLVSWDDDFCLRVAEPRIISDFDSIANGYNSCPGGKGVTGQFGEQNGMFGKTHSDEVKKKFSETAKSTFSGKSYDELYGKEKANQLKSARRDVAKAKDNSAQNNPRFDNRVYTFSHKSGEVFIGTRWDFYEKDVTRPGVSEVINGNQKSHRGWILI